MVLSIQNLCAHTRGADSQLGKNDDRLLASESVRSRESASDHRLSKVAVTLTTAIHTLSGPALPGPSHGHGPARRHRDGRQVFHWGVCVLLLQDLLQVTKLFAWGEESGGHVLRETTSRGLCGLVAHHALVKP